DLRQSDAIHAEVRWACEGPEIEPHRNDLCEEHRSVLPRTLRGWRRAQAQWPGTPESERRQAQSVRQPAQGGPRTVEGEARRIHRAGEAEEWRDHQWRVAAPHAAWPGRG